METSGRVVRPREIRFHRTKGIPYFDISAKTNYNFNKPFLSLARRLLGDCSITFEPLPALLPPRAHEVTTDVT